MEGTDKAEEKPSQMGSPPQANLPQENAVAVQTPSGPTMNPHDPDVELPDSVLVDPDGKLYCIFCKRFVPPGTANLQLHIKGKRHENSVKQSSPADFAARRANLIARFTEQAAKAPPPAAEQKGKKKKAKQIKIEQAVQAAHAAQAAELAQSTSAVIANQEVSENHPISSAAGSAKSSSEEAMAADSDSSQHFQNVQINKEEFLSSILDHDDDSSSDALGEKGMLDSDNERESDSNVAFARNTAFGPLQYQPPDGDNFFDSMPEETERTNRGAELLSILESVSFRKNNGSGPETEAPKSDSANEGSANRLVNIAEMIPIFVPESSRNQALSGGQDNDSESDGESESSDDDEKDVDPDLPAWMLGPDAIEAVKYAKDSTVALHYEILEFARFMSPTAAESSSREKVSNTVQSIVKMLWPECRVELFGSYATGIHLPTSDIDMCVMNTPKSGDSSELEQLAQSIRNITSFARRVFVIKARVPLVKIVARESGVQCDISFNQENGPRNVPVIKRYLGNYPALRPLLLVVKCFLQQRSLNEVFTGGLGSYAILLLVVSHLQMLRYNFPGSKANLGAVLQSFFLLYGRLFNYCLVGIAVKDSGSYYDKIEKYDTTPQDTLRFSIEDPNDFTNEIGRNSYGASRVRKAFGNASRCLMEWKRDYLASPLTPLSTILQSDKMFKKRRKYVRRDWEERNIMRLQESIKATNPQPIPRSYATTIELSHGETQSHHRRDSQEDQYRRNYHSGEGSASGRRSYSRSWRAREPSGSFHGYEKGQMNRSQNYGPSADSHHPPPNQMHYRGSQGYHQGVGYPNQYTGSFDLRQTLQPNSYSPGNLSLGPMNTQGASMYSMAPIATTPSYNNVIGVAAVQPAMIPMPSAGGYGGAPMQSYGNNERAFNSGRWNGQYDRKRGRGRRNQRGHRRARP